MPGEVGPLAWIAAPAADAVTAAHVHAWQPVRGWAARYRCPGCGAFGYRGKLVTEGVYEIPDSVIVPYKCRVCSAPAVAHDGANHGRTSKEWRCPAHRREQR